MWYRGAVIDLLSRGGAAPAFLLVLLAGCAGLAPPDRPQDFPLHAADHPFFDLHWRLDEKEGEVRAVGVVEAARQGDFSEVVLELRGIDPEGRVVSRALGATLSGRLDRWGTQPFSVRLRPTGREARFELDVWTYIWANDGDGAERDD